MRISYLLLSMSLLLWSCDASKKAQQPNRDAEPNQTQKLTLAQEIEVSSVFSKSFTGFLLYDPEQDVVLDSTNADKYFIPASNTKVFTCYTSLKALPEKIPALKYVVKGDSLIFWGTGDPTFMNPDLKENTQALNFLKSRTEQLFFLPQGGVTRFGPGWAWDDYNDYYSAERSEFPIFGNFATVKMRKGVAKPTIYPTFFNTNLREDKALPGRYTVRRDEGHNTFRYNNPTLKYYKKDVPFKTGIELTTQLLSHAIGKEVELWQGSKALKNASTVETLYSVGKDEMLAKMMINSENFLAEQLLYLVSHQWFNSFDMNKTIRKATKDYLSDSPQKLVWKDGSGLSRYNLFTPRSMVHVLDKMRDEFGEERVLKLFPVGGRSGTIRNWYKADVPYVYAKTGTLSNRHCLSGYLKAKSGKTLIFSFMHNNYVTYSSPLKKEMQVFLEKIRDRY